jgi:hypothetical protein
VVVLSCPIVAAISLVISPMWTMCRRGHKRPRLGGVGQGVNDPGAREREPLPHGPQVVPLLGLHRTPAPGDDDGVAGSKSEPSDVAG